MCLFVSVFICVEWGFALFLINELGHFPPFDCLLQATCSSTDNLESAHQIPQFSAEISKKKIALNLDIYLGIILFS